MLTKKWVSLRVCINNKGTNKLFKISFQNAFFIYPTDVDVSPSVRKYSHGIERILEFGKDLSQMGQQLEKESKMTDEERQMLEVSTYDKIYILSYT